MSTAQSLKKHGLPTIDSTIYKIPFTHGWKRVLVSKGNDSCNPSCSSKLHIHYITPEKEIIRSINELGSYIKSGSMEFSLTPSNFTFLLVAVNNDSLSEYSLVEQDDISSQTNDSENGISEGDGSESRSANSQQKENIMGKIFESLSDNGDKGADILTNCSPSSPNHSVTNGISNSDELSTKDFNSTENPVVSEDKEVNEHSDSTPLNQKEEAMKQNLPTTSEISETIDTEETSNVDSSKSPEKESDNLETQNNTETQLDAKGDHPNSPLASNSKKRSNEVSEDLVSATESGDDSNSATKQPRRKRRKFSERSSRESITEKVKQSADKLSESGSETSDDVGSKKSVKVNCILNSTDCISEISTVSREQVAITQDLTKSSTDQIDSAPKHNGVHEEGSSAPSKIDEKVSKEMSESEDCEIINLDKDDHSYTKSADKMPDSSLKDKFASKFVEMFDASLLEDIPVSVKSNPCNKFCHQSSKSAIVVCFFCKLVNHINCKKFYTVQHQPCCYMCYSRSPSDLSRLFNLATAVVHVSGNDKQPKVISYKSDANKPTTLSFATVSRPGTTFSNNSNVTILSNNATTVSQSPSTLPTASSVMKAKLSAMVNAKQQYQNPTETGPKMPSLSSVMEEVLASPPTAKSQSTNSEASKQLSRAGVLVNLVGKNGSQQDQSTLSHKLMNQEHALLRYSIPATPDKMSNRTGLILRIQDKTFLQLQSTSILKEIFSMSSCSICINQRPYRVEPCNIGLVNNHFQVLLSQLPSPENGFYHVAIYKSLEVCMADLKAKEQLKSKSNSSDCDKSQTIIIDDSGPDPPQESSVSSRPSYVLPVGWMAQGSIDALDEIFQSLDSLPDLLNCRVVCKAWKRVIDSSNLWRNMSIDIGSCDITEKAGRFLKKRNCRRLQLDLRGFCNPSSLTNEILISMSKDFHYKLKELTIDLSTRTETPILNLPLTQLLDHLKNLTYLKLVGAKKGVFIEESADSPDVMAANLTDLHVEYVENISYLFTYPSCCVPNLKSLSVGDCSLVTEMNGTLLENVENLTLYFDSEVNITSFDWVETSLTKVNSLTLSGMSINENLVTFITKMGAVTSLETLNLSCVINSPFNNDVAYVHEVAEMSLLIPIIPNFLSTFNWFVRFTKFDQSEATEKCRNVIVDSANVELRKLFPNIRFQVTVTVEK